MSNIYGLDWSLSYVYVDGGFVLTDLGEDCQDRGLQPLNSKECITDSTDFIQTHYPEYEFKEYETTSEYPKGCYIFVGKDDYKGYFNMHSSGSAESRSRAICKIKRGI